MLSTSSQTGGMLTRIGSTASTSRMPTNITSQMPYAEYRADHGSVMPLGPSQTASTRYTSSSGRSLIELLREDERRDVVGEAVEERSPRDDDQAEHHVGDGQRVLAHLALAGAGDDADADDEQDDRN